MAKKDSGNYHNFRLSKNNAQHVRVDKVLRDLNPAFVKSKNQYIADAIDYYTRALDNDDLTMSGATASAKKGSYITRGELDEIKREIRDNVMIEVQKEMLALLGTFTGKMATTLPIVVQQSAMRSAETKEYGVEADDTINGLASKWG